MQFPIFSDNDMNKILQSWVEEQQQKQFKNMIFIATRQDEVMELAYQFLKKQKHIDDDDIRYSSEKFSFSIEEYEFLFDNIIQYAKEKDLFYNNQNEIFETMFTIIRYKDSNIVLRIISGQGTASQMFFNKEDNSYFTYEDFKIEQLKEKDDD